MKQLGNILTLSLAALCCLAFCTTNADAKDLKAKVAPQGKFVQNQRVLIKGKRVVVKPQQVEVQIEPVNRRPVNGIVRGRPGLPVQKILPNYKPLQQVLVQTVPKYKGAKAGKSSTPAEERGLQVTIQPEKDSFNISEPLAFIVTLKNISKKTILLHRGEVLGPEPTLVIGNQKTAAQWKVKADFTDNKRLKSVSLKPGEELKRTLIASAANYRNVRPGVNMPFPQPIRPQPPVFRGRPVQIKIINGKAVKPAKKAAPKKAIAPKRVRPAVKQVQQQGGGNAGIIQGAPARVAFVKAVAVKKAPAKKVVAVKKANAKVLAKKPAVQPVARPMIAKCGVGCVAMPPQSFSVNLPCGKGMCHARLFLEFKKDPSKTEYNAPHWTGKIVSKTVEFEVAEYAVIIDNRKK